MMVRSQVVGWQHWQIAGSREVAHHHVAPRLVIHRELAVPEAIRHRRLDLLSTCGPLDCVARAHIDDATLARLVVGQLQLTADVLGQESQHRRLRRRRDGRQFVEKDDDEVALFGKTLRLARPRHRQQSHALGSRYGKAAKVLRLANRPDQDEDPALDADACESRLEALGELGLADTGEPGDVHRNARLQADGDQLDEVSEVHGVAFQR